METKLIKLLRDWVNGDTTWHAGDTLEVDKATADELVTAKTAVLVDVEAEAKALAEVAAKQTADEQKQATLIAETVKSVIGALPVSRPPSVAKVHEKIEDDPQCGFKSLGEQVRAVMALRNDPGNVDKRLLVANEKAPTGLGTVVDSDGGFLVVPEYSRTIMQKTYDSGQIVSKCTRVPMGSQEINIPFVNETSRADGSRQGGVRVYWKAEAAQATASKPVFGMLKLKLNKLMGFCWETDEIMKWSGPTLDSLLTSMFANEFAFKIDDSIARGTGAGMPLGVLNSPALITVTKQDGQDADTVVKENIDKMWSRMHARNRSNAAWFINQEVEPQLDNMSLGVGAAGVPVYLPPGGISETPYARLKGRPVIPVETCSALGDAGDIALCDMSQYLYAEDSAGIEGATSIHLHFDYGETALRWTLLIDGQPWWNSPLTPYKATASQTLSPFVTLGARA